MNGEISREARVHAGGGEYIGPESKSYLIHVGVAGQSALDRAEKLLAGIPGGVDKAVKSASSRAASHLRSASVKAIRERYAISQANIRANENIEVNYDYKNGICAAVKFAGKRIPLHRFDGAAPSVPTKDTSRRFGIMHGTFGNGDGIWNLMYPGVPARGHALKDTAPTVFKNAFTARMRSTGHVGIYERTGGMTGRGKDEIEEFFGPAVPQMLGSQKVAEKLTHDSMDRFEERLDHEINAILNGWR